MPLAALYSVFSGAKGALEVCKRDVPQVVLTDLAMSPMTGRDLIVALKSECPSAVPVVLTGYGTVERAVDLMRLGAFDVLTKPFGQASAALDLGYTPTWVNALRDGGSELSLRHVFGMGLGIRRSF